MSQNINVMGRFIYSCIVLMVIALPFACKHANKKLNPEKSGLNPDPQADTDSAGSYSVNIRGDSISYLRGLLKMRYWDWQILHLATWIA